ncbi:MAG: serine/threonine-protein kinase [Betaproteobacteria bacterium]
MGLLGRGGMGEVYRADDLKLEQTVALKFLPRALEGNPERLERLYGEVRMARQVSHPHVCRVWDVGEAEGQHFISMEFVDGENLASLLRRIGRLHGDKALETARQVTAGLAAAHDKGVLHRDLKPANVMLDGQGQVRLTDFGLAGLVESLRGDDVRSGTPSYMSPEQLQGREVTTRSDIYALGLLLYELFTGRRAFEGRSLAELTRRHRDERPIDPSAIVPDLDASVERTIVACLEKDPKKRPPSALAVGAMLTGRDPLEAAIAAGETPSPELVAAAGETEGLRPRTAAVCLGLVLAAILAVPPLQQSTQLLFQVPVEKSPEALEDRARELVARLGHRAPAADSEMGFSTDEEYFRETRQSDRSPDRWDKLATGEPPVLSWWFRQSPRPLDATGSSGRVSWDDPPQVVSGMAAVRYDLTGRLLALSVVPPQVEPSADPVSAGAPDWNLLFAAARLDPTKLKPVAPRWNPPFQTDARAAWEGVWPRRPEIPIRIEAAGYRGSPVWFEIVSPWTRPDRDRPFALSTGERVARGTLILLLLALVTAGALLAKRNIRLGRGDRRGAFRLALALSALGFGAFVLSVHHVADSGLELLLLARCAGLALLMAALVWLFYLALEPYVRRLRPWTLVSWARLLNGGLRDAVVGRDVLIGMVWGGAVAVLFPLLARALRWFGQPTQEPQSSFNDTLLTTRTLLAYVLSLPRSATTLGLGLLLLFLVLRFLTRRDLPAAALVVAILTATLTTGSTDSRIMMAGVGLVIYGSFTFVLLRFGVLAAIAGAFTVDLLAGIPESIDATSWTGSATLVVVPLLALVAVAAFRSATSGSLGLKRYVAGEASSSRPV